MKFRSVVKKVESVEQAEGRGARVRRSIGRPELRSLDPFLMLDEFNVKAPAGFPDHPHRGFETVTYMMKGSFMHEDFMGHKGVIAPGDLQWMTAGRGIVHSEKPIGEEAGRGLQLWVNLAREHKMCAPKYQELLAKDVPKTTKDGVSVTVIAGDSYGIKSPVYTLTPTYYLDFQLQPNAVMQQPIPKGWNSFIYVLEGDGVFGASCAEGAANVAASGASSAVAGGTRSTAHHTLVLSNTGEEDVVCCQAGASGSRFVLLAGQPLKEPVVQYGPFVMTTEREIRQAFEDYQEGKNGFEAAHAWEATRR